VRVAQQSILSSTVQRSANDRAVTLKYSSNATCGLPPAQMELASDDVGESSNDPPWILVDTSKPKRRKRPIHEVFESMSIDDDYADELQCEPELPTKEDLSVDWYTRCHGKRLNAKELRKRDYLRRTHQHPNAARRKNNNNRRTNNSSTPEPPPRKIIDKERYRSIFDYTPFESDESDDALLAWSAWGSAIEQAVFNFDEPVDMLIDLYNVSLRTYTVRMANFIAEDITTLTGKPFPDTPVSTPETTPLPPPKPQTIDEAFPDDTSEPDSSVPPVCKDFLKSMEGVVDTNDEDSTKWLSHFENIVIMGYQLSRATSYADAFVAVMAFVKMNTQKSVIMSIVDVIEKLCGGKEDPNADQQVNAWDGATVVRKWDLFKANTAWKRVSYLITAAMSLSVCTIKEIEWSPLGFELISLKAIQHQVHAVDFIDAVVKTFSWLASTGYRVFTERSLVPILYSDQEMQKFNELNDYVLAHADTVITGNGEDIGDFERKVNDLQKQISVLKSHRDKGPTAVWLQSAYAKAVHIQERIHAKRKNTASREAPVCFGLTGSSGVGKSSLAEIVMRVAHSAMDIEYDPSRIMTLDLFDKYQSTMTSDITGMNIDDLGNGKAQFAVTSPSDLIIKFFNNVAAQAVKAELNAKGTVFIDFKVGVITSNFEDYNVSLYTDKREASLRRMFHTRVAIKPKYRKLGGVSLDTSHPDLVDCPLTKDIWELTIEEAFVRNVKGNTDTCEFRVISEVVDGKTVRCEKLDLKTYLQVVVILARRHSQQQKALVKRSIDFKTMKCCTHCKLPIAVCDDVGQCNKHQKVNSVLSEFAADVTRSYFESWISGYTAPFYALQSWLTTSMFGYSPIRKMTTKALQQEMSYILDGCVKPWCLSWIPRKWTQTQLFEHAIGHWAGLSAMYDCRKHFYVAFYLEVLLAIFLVYLGEFYALILLIPITIVSGLLFLAHLYARTRIYEKAYLSRRDALPVSVELTRSHKGAMACTALAAMLGAFYMWNKTRTHQQPNGENSPTEEKQKSPLVITDQQPGWFGSMFNTLHFKVETQPASITATTRQVVQSVSKNHGWASFTDPNGTVQYCNIIFPQKYIAWIPRHMFHEDLDMNRPMVDWLKVEAYLHNGAGGKFTFIAESKCLAIIPDLDVVAAFVPGCPDVAAGFMKWLPVEKPKGSVYCSLNTCVYRSFERTEERVLVACGEVGHAKLDGFWGGRYQSTTGDVGRCMAPLVTESSKPCLVGFHIASAIEPMTPFTDKRRCTMITITLDQAQTFEVILRVEKKCLISANTGIIPETQYGRTLLSSTKVHPKSPIAEMDHTSVIVPYGSVKVRREQKSNATESPLSPLIQKHCGVENKWFGTPLTPNWKWFNATLDHIANPSEPFLPSVVAKAKEDYLAPLLPLMKEWVKKEKVEPLTLRECILGIPGKRFIDPLPQDTSMGPPVFGPKWLHFEEVRDGEILVDRVPSDEVMEEVNRLRDCWRKGERAYPLTAATLKDEVVAKEKVRVFQAAAVAMSIWIRKYFLPIARFIHFHPLECESAVGVNAFGPEWEALMDHCKKYADDGQMIAWDYSKYDVRMNAQMTNASWSILIDLAEAAGYDESDLYFMRMMVSDIIHPLIDWNGSIIMAFNLNTSGHSLTVDINGLSGSLYLRIGFFTVYPNETDFRSRVSPLTYGDDVAGSVHPDFRGFNFISFRDFLAKHNMKITRPDKKEGGEEFMDVGDVDFLKRKSNFIPEIGHPIGKLDEDSIFKSLHMNIKSSSVTPLEVATSCLDTAMHEWFAYGREHYDMRRAQMLKVIEDLNVPLLPSVVATFDERVDHWKEKYEAAVT
jgi:hypothetical protein